MRLHPQLQLQKTSWHDGARPRPNDSADRAFQRRQTRSYALARREISHVNVILIFCVYEFSFLTFWPPLLQILSMIYGKIHRILLDLGEKRHFEGTASCWMSQRRELRILLCLTWLPLCQIREEYDRRWSPTAWVFEVASVPSVQ
jgi:hypothetical protein